jgi:DNA-binding transcriptional ArsR family regulator
MMTYQSTAALEALADPTRRAIVVRLRERPLSVGLIAADLPVTRPAVSSHLRVLTAAGLVTHERLGTRNIYALRPEGLSELREWLDELWSDALEAFATYVDRTDDSEEGTP